MSVNFNLLDPNMPANIAGSVYAGQQQQQQNQLAKQQAQMRQQEMGMRQQEIGMRQQGMAEQATERQRLLANQERRTTFLRDLGQKLAEGGKVLDRPTLGEMISSGIPEVEKLGFEGIKSLDEQQQFEEQMGRIAPKAEVAPAGIDATAPSNALAPAATPTNALTAGYSRPQIEQMLISSNPKIRDMGKNLLSALPKPVAEPSSLVELKAYMKMTPAERADFEKLQKIKAANVTATSSSTTPTAKSLAAPVGARAETSLVKAEGAIGMMENANAVREALNTGNVIAGPLAGARTKFAQVLELAGAGDKEKLIATRNTVQGLASLTLESRAELKGQGQITDTETKLLERARSADIGELTIPELQQVVNVSQRLANRMWSGHQNLLKTMETDPAAADSLKYYRPTGALPQALGEGKPKAEVDKRKAGLDQIFGNPQKR